jgi:hypothetical protein
MVKTLMPPLKLLVHLTMVIFCTQIFAANDFSPSREDECNQSCSFDHEEYIQCISNVAAFNYVKDALTASLADITKKVHEQVKTNSCTCARAKLESNGHFSSVEIIKTTDTNAGRVVQRALLELDMPPVPSGAACLLKAPQNPIPISVSNSL